MVTILRRACEALCLVLTGAFPGGAFAAADGKPTVVPAVLKSVSPTGIARGEKAMLTLDGARLAGATRVFFDERAITGRVLPAADPKNMDQVRVEAAVGSEARIGVHRLFLQTPLGTTGSVPFAVGDWPETKEAEPNDTPATAQALTLPSTVVGAIDKPGDVDYFRFQARTGQELVFQVVAAALRSRLDAVLTLTDATGRVLAEGNSTGSRPDLLLGHRFTSTGTCILQLRDFENGGGIEFHYRLNIGEFPIVTTVFPLGVRSGTATEVALTGFNLGPKNSVRVIAPSITDGAEVTADRAKQQTSGSPHHPLIPSRSVEPSPHQSIPLPDQWLASPRLAVGEDPEVTEAEPNDDAANAQRVTVPVTINGRIAGSRAGAPDADEFCLAARRGQRLVLEVAARHLGSPLDSFLEVLDTGGRPIERATLRPVAETSLTLSNRDSGAGSFRILSWTDLAVNDFVFVGRELLQITRLPGGPDEDISFRSFRGPRIGFLDTTPEAHSVGESIYKVLVYPPGRSFSPNGMPVFHLYYQNDDGGVLYGKDSRLTFDPPADGEYLVRISDIRGQQGPDFAYRLSIHPPRPDFRLTTSPDHPNLLRGSSVPVSVGVERYDGFEGPVEVRLEGLPAGFSAAPGVISAGEDSVTLALSAAADAVTPALAIPSPIRVVGRARVGGRDTVRTVEPENGVRLITVLPEPDIRVATDVRRVALRPGGTVEVTARVERRNGFKGRVPIEVRNLPFGVQVRDVGLNGVLITEQQTSRRFVITAAPWVKPQTRPFFAVGRVESDPATEVAAEPLELTVIPGPVQVRR